MQNIKNTFTPPAYPQPDSEGCATQSSSEGLADKDSTTARASAISPESHFLGSDKSNHPANSQPGDLLLTDRQTATCTADETYHTPEFTSAFDQSLTEKSSASCPATDAALLKPLPDEVILDTLPCLDTTLSSKDITLIDLQFFSDELVKFRLKIDKELLDEKYLDKDDLRFHKFIYSELALLKRFANKYQVFKDNSHKLVDLYNNINRADKIHFDKLPEYLFLSDDMCAVTLWLANHYRVLDKMLCRWSSRNNSPGQQLINFLSEFIVCNMSFVICLVESEIRKGDFIRHIAVRAPVKPKIRKFHSILHVPPRKQLEFLSCDSRMLSEGISNMLTTIATGTWEALNWKDNPQDILKVASGCLFSSIDRYRKEADDHGFQPVCVDKQTIGQHLFCAELLHAALLSGRWDEANKAFEATTRTVLHNEYSLEPVIQALKHNNTAGINIEKWHSDLNEYTQSRSYHLSFYFVLGLEAASVYLSNLLAHKENETENQSPLIKMKKTEDLQKILDVLNRWAGQLHELDLLTDDSIKYCKYPRRLSLARQRIQTLTKNHEMAIRDGFHEAKKVIMQPTATDGITDDNPQLLPECLKSLLVKTLIQNNDILKLINKECDACHPGIHISELDRQSCEWLTSIFVNNAQSPHTELLLTFSHCSYDCALIVEHVCECAAIFCDLEACLTHTPANDSPYSLGMTKEKWKEKIKTNASGIKEKIDQFDKTNQNIKSCFTDVFKQLNKIRQQVINGQDRYLKIALFESIHATLYHSLQQLQHLNSALITVSSKRIDILRNEFPTIANLEQNVVSCGKKLKKNIAFIAGCVKDLNNSKELSLVKTTGSHKPNPVPINNGRSKKQTSKNRDTLANFVANNNKSVRLDTPETLATRAYFHEQIAKGVQALNRDRKPVAYLGSRAYQVQVQSLWGSEAFKLATSSDLIPAEISPGVIKRSVTPRDTDLLVLNREDFSSIKDQLYDCLKEAAKEGGYLPDKYEPLKTNDFDEVYYGINCCFCNLILRLKGTYTRKDWIYVVDLITPMESKPSTLLSYDSPVLASGDSTHARPLTAIMIDELNLAVGQAAGPVRALMAMTRINVLAALESLEPKLDHVSVIVLMHVLERLQDSYPDPALAKLASTLRSRAFNRVAGCL